MRNGLVQINEGLVFVVAAAALICYRVVRNLTAGRISIAREILVNLFFVYICGVVSVTFFPMNIVLYAFDPYDANLIPFVETIQMLQNTNQPGVMLNLLGNLALLAPLGIFLPILFKKARHINTILWIGFLVSFGIEIFQLTLKVRVFDVDDVIINLLGVLLGFCIFALLNKIPFISRLLAIFSDQERVCRKKAFIAYGLFALLAFLSIYSSQIINQTQTEKMITEDLARVHRQLLGTPKFGEFLMVFSQSDNGVKVVEIYRRVFFDRYTLFETQDDLQLGEVFYTVSGMSTVH